MKKTLGALCADVESAMNDCMDVEDTHPDQTEIVAERAAAKLLRLGRRHREIKELYVATRSPKAALRYTLRPHVPPGGLLLFRDEGRWMCDKGANSAVDVAPDLHDATPAELLAVELNYEIVADYRHVVIVMPR